MTRNTQSGRRPGALRSLLSLPPESVIDRFLPRSTDRAGTGFTEPESVAGLPAPSDKTRFAPCPLPKDHTIMVLPDADRPVAQYILDDPYEELKRPKEMIFMTSYKNLNRTKSALAASSRVHLQATAPIRRVSVAQRVMRSQGAARRKPLCGSCNTSLYQGAPPGSHARKPSSKDGLRPDSSSGPPPFRVRDVEEGTDKDNRWTRVHPPKYNDVKDLLQGPTGEWEEVGSVEASMHIFRRLRRKSEPTVTAAALRGHKSAGIRRARDGKEVEVGQPAPSKRSLRPPPLRPLSPLTPLASEAAARARGNGSNGPLYPLEGHRVRDLPPSRGGTFTPTSPSEVSELSAPLSCARGVDPPLLAPLPSVIIPSFFVPCADGSQGSSVDSYTMWMAEQQRLLLSDHDIAAMAAQCQGPEEVDECLDDNGTTLLMAAAYRGLEGPVRDCLANMADVRKANTYGNTGLHFCIARGHRDIAGLLVNAGASAEQKNNLGLTCFERVDV